LTTSGGTAWRAPAVAVAAGAAVVVFLCGAAPAGAGSYLQADVGQPDSSAGALVVETAPPGLLILIDEVAAGRSPVGPLWIAPKTVHVRAIPADPGRFDIAADAATADVRAGARTRVFLDLRPSLVLRTEPEPARVLLEGPAGDTFLGETPLRLRPAVVERGAVRFSARNYADSLIDAGLLIGWSDRSGTARIALRRIAPEAPPARTSRPVLRRRWLQWTLTGVGAGLTVAAAIFKREGDRWYERYQVSSDRAALETYFSRAERYDRLSLASLAAGQVLFTGGVLLLANGTSR
jgi:hypothetical protein